MIPKLLYIPDTQVKHGHCINHIKKAGEYLVKSRPDCVVFAGDWWDMPSLSKFSTNLELEGERIINDIIAGKDAMRAFLKPLKDLQSKQKKSKKKAYKPRMVYTIGNHCPPVRIPRYIEQFPILEGILRNDTKSWLEKQGMEVYDFLDIVSIENIMFSHYFQNPYSAKRGPLSGTIETMLKNAGFSFIQGHQQGYKMGRTYLGNGEVRLGIMAGSFYPHNENFMGLQGNKHWRGILELTNVENGNADVRDISLKNLMKGKV